MDPISKIRNIYTSLPDKKKYVEFLTALLTVPVLLTIIATNLNNLNKQSENKQEETAPAPVVENDKSMYSILPDEKNDKKPASDSAKDSLTPASPSLTSTPSSGECKKEVGPVRIVTPEEGQKIVKDPVCIDISYKTQEYCAVVWSYRINSSPWSDYTDKSICLYNLTPGEKNFELKVKSISSGDEVILKRTFIYDNPNATTTPSSLLQSTTSTNSSNTN